MPQTTTTTTPNTKRPNSALLIPTKRPLHSPTKQTPRNLNPSSRPASIKTKRVDSTPTQETASETETKTGGQRVRKEEEPVFVEVDLSNAPQLFLEPDVWSRVLRRAVEEGDGDRDGVGRAGRGVEDGERGPEAEFGGMAVRSRRNVRTRGRGIR